MRGLLLGLALLVGCGTLEVGVLDREVCASSEVEYRQIQRRFPHGTSLMRGLELRLERCYRAGLL